MHSTNKIVCVCVYTMNEYISIKKNQSSNNFGGAGTDYGAVELAAGGKKVNSMETNCGCATP